MNHFEDYFLNLLIREAKNSFCRVQKAAIIIKEVTDENGVKDWKILGWGANKSTSKTNGAICESCNKDESDTLNGCVQHAEKIAIADALGKGYSLVGAFICCAVIKNGFIYYPVRPSCIECAEIIADFGIQFLVYQDKNKVVYEPEKVVKLFNS